MDFTTGGVFPLAVRQAFGRLAAGERIEKDDAMSRPTSALLVDDEPHVRVYLRMLLKQLGVERIIEAGDGVEALALFKAEHPEVVLLDVVMPGATGPSVLEDLRRIDPAANVIVVTSQNALKTVEDMHGRGAVAYVLKHTPRDQMVKMLEEALDAIGSGESAR